MKNKKNPRKHHPRSGNTKSGLKVWRGRFESGPAELMERFSNSLEVDRAMWQEDLAVNHAWTKALRAAKIITPSEASEILQALRTIEEEFRRGCFQFQPHDEDIHVAIERRLTELVGESGAKIHTGRSRNDQVVTDFRLYLKRKVRELKTAFRNLVSVVVEQAEASQKIIMPGYTHTQQAQPIRLSHYLLSAFYALRRHCRQLEQFSERIDELPLGCGALAGAAFPIDRKLLARELGFARVMENSVDATGTRSFCSEIVFICADICITLSRYCHDLILWSSQEFGFVDPGEKFATGSSMMPNKKNPDAFELMRGKAAVVIGLLAGLLSLQKGIPVAYSRDLQEDKKTVFEALKITQDSLEVFAGALATCRFRADKMEAAIDSGLFATDIADYLVRKGVSFRQAHHLVAQAVQHAERVAFRLHELPIAFWKALHPAFDDDVMKCFDAAVSVERRNIIGGTSFRQVKNQLRQAKKWLSRTNKGVGFS
ncbi:MAG: argininosuccinate lyase [candidate division KSB1 bacterium]|nr:argininosuccinate lyase [candidate division KSB1 bacterium]